VLALARFRQGQLDEALRVARSTIRHAERKGAESALARACSVVGLALLYSKRGAPAPYFERALEIHRRLGERDLESRALGNLSFTAYREGRWRDAESLWREAAEVSRRAGDLANAGVSHLNLGELLSDQGRLDEARTPLTQGLRLLRATGRDQAAAYASLMLARLDGRRGERDAARRLLEQTRDEVLQLDARYELDLADALLAEVELLDGNPAEALHLTDRLLRAATQHHAPLVQRVRGAALVAAGATESARVALEGSLLAARSQHADYEVALTLDVLARLNGSGGAGAGVGSSERDRLLRRLGVVSWTPYPIDGEQADRRRAPARLPVPG
jgi:tetratricopeptide (TPR) repeat protein